MTDFEWDEKKNQQNQKKHGISFEEAATVFVDPLAILLSDDEHSWGEQRSHIIGEAAFGDVLVVTYTERGNKIRIISARTPTRRELRDYEEGI
jgi:hypothetical protein